MPTIKGLRITLIIVAVAAVIGGIAFFMQRSAAPTPASVPQAGVTAVPVAHAPESFPNIPLDPSATVLQNYTARAADGRVQATRAVQTVASVLSNFAYYKRYLQNASNGWTFMGELNAASDPNHRALFAKNASGTLTIVISAKGSGSVVDVSFAK